MPELGPDVNFSYASHKAVNEYKEGKAVCIYIAILVFYLFANLRLASKSLVYVKM